MKTILKNILFLLLVLINSFLTHAQCKTWERFVKETNDSKVLTDAIDENADLITAWAALEEAGASEAITKNPNRLTEVDDLLKTNSEVSLEEIISKFNNADVNWKKTLDNYEGEIYSYNSRKFIGASKKSYSRLDELDDLFKRDGPLWEDWEKNVTYITDLKERQKFELFFDEEGNAVNYLGEIIDTNKSKSVGIDGVEKEVKQAIYVMSKDGKIYFSNYQKVKEFHHSSFLAGEDISAAGEIFIEKGKIKIINNQSGHYKPDFNNVKSNLKTEFSVRGINTENIRFIKSF